MSGGVQDLEELRIPFRYFFQRYFDERVDEQFKEEKTNENFMEEKFMNFRLYPFYIKKGGWQLHLVECISQVAEEIVPQLLTVAIEQVGFKACLIQYAIQIPPVGADFLGKLRLMEFLTLYLVGHHFAYTHENTMVFFFFFFFLVFHKQSIVNGTCRPSTARKTERCGLFHHIHEKPCTPPLPQ